MLDIGKNYLVGMFNLFSYLHHFDFLGCTDIPGIVDKHGFHCGDYKKSWCKHVKLWESSAERKCCICGGGKKGISSSRYDEL